MLRKFLPTVAVVALCLFGLYRIRMSLRSPAERLRYQVSDMVDSFNRGRVREVMSSFHPDFIDANSGAGWDEVHKGLGALWFQNRGDGGKFLLQFQWIKPFEPQMDEDAGVATSTVEFEILDIGVDPPRVRWNSPAELKFVYENGGWRLAESKAVSAHPW